MNSISKAAIKIIKKGVYHGQNAEDNAKNYFLTRGFSLINHLKEIKKASCKLKTEEKEHENTILSLKKHLHNSRQRCLTEILQNHESTLENLFQRRHEKYLKK